MPDICCRHVGEARHAASPQGYKKLAPAVSTHSIRRRFTLIHFRYEVPEGPAVEDMMIPEFPSCKEAQAGYHCSAYWPPVRTVSKEKDYRSIHLYPGPCSGSGGYFARQRARQPPELGL